MGTKPAESDRILIATADAETVRSLREGVVRADCRAEQTDSLRDWESYLRRSDLRAIVLDLELSGSSLTDLPSAEDPQWPGPIVLAIVPPGDVVQAVAALRAGAAACLRKPVSAEEIAVVLHNHLQRQALLIENRRLYEEARGELAERRVAEEALRDSQERFRTIFHSAIDGIAITDPATQRFCSVNAAICRMTRYTQAELCGLHLRDLHPQEDLRQLRATFMQQLSGESSLARGIRVRRKDGSTFYADINSAPMVLGGKTYLMGLFRDVTEQRKTEAALQRAQRLEAIGTLAGGIAHDFNNILYAIVGYARLVLDELPEESASRQHLEQVLAAADRASDLVRRILDFGRQTIQEPRVMRLQPVVEETVRFTRETLPATIRIERRIQAACGAVKADAAQMQQLLLNLCSNSARAMLVAGGQLTVALEETEPTREARRACPGLRPGRYARLMVSDTGGGMDDETLERIFEPYFTTRPHGEGTGLGLAAVHGIVQQHGGAIHVESHPGQGTQFAIYLPICAEAPSREGSCGEMRALPDRMGGRILVVDDEEPLAELLRTALERMGYDVVAHTRGEDALAAFRDDPRSFAAVVADQTMPGLTGADLAQALLAERPELPIVLCTGYSETVREEDAEAIGVQAYMMKPVDMDVLGRTLHRLIQHPTCVEG
ncbi:MAG: PAS domain S-box protein [Candidatus Eisenbacteria bacterium]|nr:PAS domain S-box protein [Candidatus Eisenbacteria bacterium]